MVNDSLNPPLYWRAIHVAVQHRHEDRYAPHGRHAEAELRRRRGEAREPDDPVRRRDDEVATLRRNARGIAKKERAPEGRNEAEPTERRPNPPQDQSRDSESRDEQVAFGMDRRGIATDRVEQVHWARLKNSAGTHGADREECHGSNGIARGSSGPNAVSAASISSSSPARRSVSSAASTSRCRLHSAA